MEKKVAEVVGLIDAVGEDTSVPKNIRRALAEAKEKLRGSEELSTRVSSAVYSIEAVSEDINMPMHARTQIWTILSALESIKAV
ncbi:MAG: UPF0147 family protein [Candidatus Micrarchaeota archaeon]|nr:UPF0147 family protein [Candidatus Micrarchaeota archaeon]